MRIIACFSRPDFVPTPLFPRKKLLSGGEPLRSSVFHVPTAGQFSLSFPRVIACSGRLFCPPSMGCASSSPILDTGKTFVEGAKESMSDTISKGEKALMGEFIHFRFNIYNI